MNRIPSSVLVAAVLVAFSVVPSHRAHASQAAPPARPSPPAEQRVAPPELEPAALPPSMEGRGGEPTLRVGDPAPPLDVRGFVLGDPIDVHGEGPVRLLFFWSTVCVPCRASIPDLASAARRHMGELEIVTIVAEDTEAVARFVEETPWGAYMTHRIAIDRARATHDSYLLASRRHVLPMAFIIGRDGIIEWLGTPREMDEPLARIIAGEWDRAEGIAAFERRREFDRLHGQLGSQFIDATNAEDWDRLLELIGQLEAADPTATPAPTERFRVLLVRSGRVQEGYAAGRDLLNRFPRDAQILQRAARIILETPNLEPRDVELAYELAYRASEQLLHEHASYLGTVAVAHEANGRLRDAIETMIAAIARTDSRRVRDALEERLSEWQARLATGETGPAGGAGAATPGQTDNTE